MQQTDCLDATKLSPLYRIEYQAITKTSFRALFSRAIQMSQTTLSPNPETHPESYT